jgi:lipopolysaccharide transport system ATP-binding protein
VALPGLEGNGTITLWIDRLDLRSGAYRIDVGAYEREWAYAYDYHCQAYQIEVRSRENGHGVLQPPAHWELEPQSARQGAVQRNGSGSYLGNPPGDA